MRLEGSRDVSGAPRDFELASVGRFGVGNYLGSEDGVLQGRERPPGREWSGRFHRQSFIEGCKAELGEVCEKENLALESEFQPFLRGDADGDGLLSISDPIRTLHHLFLGAEALGCEDAGDANDDGRLDISDPVRTLGYLFLGGDRLPEPSFESGQDPTSDLLLCSS